MNGVMPIRVNSQMEVMLKKDASSVGQPIHIGTAWVWVLREQWNVKENNNPCRLLDLRRDR